MGDDELPIHRFATHEIKEEGLARSVFADHQAERRAAVGDAVQVFIERGDFGVAADLDVSGTEAGGNAGTQRLDESVALTWAKNGAEHVEWLYVNVGHILRQSRVWAAKCLCRRLQAKYPTNVPLRRFFGHFFLGTPVLALPPLLLFGDLAKLPQTTAQWGNALALTPARRWHCAARQRSS